ncbi:MAG TPA: DUF4203 domain-containing protein [Phycisphaerae bacterium]|nr:DUF4203 domain-containing protein [Phycisphaerae bacterium]
MQQVHNIPASMPTQEQARQSLDRLGELVSSLFSGQGEAWEKHLSAVADLQYVECSLIFVAGLVYMIWGWKIFKPLVILNIALVGGVLGGMAAVSLKNEPYWWAGMIIGAIVFGVAAWPLFRFCLALIGMAFGSMVGYAFYTELIVFMNRPDMANYPWLGAVAGFIIFGVIAIGFVKPAIILLTSLQGAMMILAASLGLLCKASSLRPELLDRLGTSPWIAQAAVAVLTLVGIIIQITRSHKAADAAENGKKEA